MAVPTEVWIILPFVLVGALLYSSVGHGGATLYLGILTLAGFTVDLLVPTVLVLNIVAAGIAFASFRSAGHLRPRLLWPFLLTSVPAAFLGGFVPLGGRTTGILLGVGLALAAARFLVFSGHTTRPGSAAAPNARVFWVLAPALGLLLGFLAGATGIGGGIFLSPLLLMFGWADVKEAAVVAAAFIVVNSAAGLAARLIHTPLVLEVLLPLIVVVALGAWAGSLLGARRLPHPALQRLLGVVLLAASLKALFLSA